MVGTAVAIMPSGQGQNPLLKSVATGSAVMLEMLSGGLFYENVKMEKQRTSLPYPQICSRMLRQGLAGFWAGFWPWGCFLGVTKGSVIGGSRAFLLDLFENTFHMSKSSADLWSGFGAGAVQGIAMSPILLARTRVNQSLVERAATAQGGKINTGFVAEMLYSMKILNQSIREDGIRVLGKGMPTMVLKRSLDWGTRFIFIKLFTERYRDYKFAGRQPGKLNDLESLAISFSGGAASCAATMPLDRIMPILQQASKSNESIVAFMRRKLAEEGLATMQRGFLFRALHTGYHTTFAIFVADKIYNLFK
jgi:hypothetical protein